MLVLGLKQSLKTFFLALALKAKPSALALALISSPGDWSWIMFYSMRFSMDLA